MIYLLIGCGILLWFIISFFKEKDKKLLEEIRMNWGRPMEKYRNFQSLEKYSKADDPEPFHTLTFQTLKDIDIENLFSLFDRTATTIGQQLLYNRITFPINNLQKLKERSSQSNYFIENVNKRESVQKILYKQEKNGTSGITQLFSGENLVIGKNKTLYKALTLLAVAGILGSIFYPVLIILFIPILE